MTVLGRRTTVHCCHDGFRFRCRNQHGHDLSCPCLLQARNSLRYMLAYPSCSGAPVCFLLRNVTLLLGFFYQLPWYDHRLGEPLCKMPVVCASGCPGCQFFRCCKTPKPRIPNPTTHANSPNAKPRSPIIKLQHSEGGLCVPKVDRICDICVPRDK